MTQSDDLRLLLSTMLMLPLDSLSPTTSLASLDSSLGGARLALGLKRLGYTPGFRRVPATFADLTTSLEAKPQASVAGARDSVVQVDPAKSSRPGEIDIGLDIQDIAALPICRDYWDHDFYKGCFSRIEIAYAIVQSDPRPHFAGFWSAKEALKKCDSEFLGTDLTRLSVHHEADGKPYFLHHQLDRTVRLIHSVSISHSGNIASAVVALPKQATMQQPG